MIDLLRRTGFLLVAMLFTVLLAVPATPVFADGNNGTIKIGDEFLQEGNDNGQGTIPHLTSCNPEIKWYGFDSGPQTATVTFEDKAPTNNTLVSPLGSQNTSFTGNGQGGVLDHTEKYSLVFSGAPHNQHGYKAKVTIVTSHSNGNDTKSKVFWIPADCEQKTVIPAAVESTPITCNAPGSYTIPSTPGVEYRVNGSQTSTPAGTYNVSVASTVTVTAHEISPAYELKGQITWTLQFTAPTNCVTPVEFTFTDPTCDELGTYIIPTTVGVDYFVNNELTPASPGKYDALTGSTVTVAAVAQTGYELVNNTSPWTHEFVLEDDCENEEEPTYVTPKKPKFTDTCFGYGEVKIPKTEGVYYEINGVRKEKGVYPYDTGSKVKVRAYEEKGYAFKEGAKVRWTHTFVTPEGCDTEEPDAPVEPKVVYPTCTAKGSYTIPASDWYEYYVNDDEEPTVPGTYTVENGTTVTISAYLIQPMDETLMAYTQVATAPKPAGSWTYTFTAPTNCGSVLGEETTTPSTPAPQVLATSTTTPASLPATGSSDVIAAAAFSLVAGLMAITSLVAKKLFVKLS